MGVGEEMQCITLDMTVKKDVENAKRCHINSYLFVLATWTNLHFLGKYHTCRQELFIDTGNLQQERSLSTDPLTVHGEKYLPIWH